MAARRPRRSAWSRINQADATQHFSVQPFKDLPASLPQCNLPAGTVSSAPMSVSVDPGHSLIYTADSVPGAIAALELTGSDLPTIWMANQRTTEFLALIGPRGRRVLVDTDFRMASVHLRTRRIMSYGATRRRAMSWLARRSSCPR